MILYIYIYIYIYIYNRIGIIADISNSFGTMPVTSSSTTFPETVACIRSCIDTSTIICTRCIKQSDVRLDTFNKVFEHLNDNNSTINTNNGQKRMIYHSVLLNAN